METAIIIVASIILVVLVLIFILIVRRSNYIDDSIENVVSLFASINERMDVVVNTENQILEALKQIAGAKRLMEIIKIEGKEDLGINPEDFEPKKEEILKVMLETLNDEEMRKRYRKDSDTFAFCILQHSGFQEFVKNPSQVRKPLTRVLANRDYEVAKRLIRKMVKVL